ncbi:MAG: hypothetical protein BWY79_01093 [Actinobacteria bacterium ADurb.Bin444]|nr:MAG: hypothetical protein BWY79_01093 [Actinobacteria bacterium ADurb.Bin444]
MTLPWLPNTFPKRTDAMRIPAWRLLSARRSSSEARLVAPMTQIGSTALSVEMFTKARQPKRTAVRATSCVTRMLFNTASSGARSMRGTCL